MSHITKGATKPRELYSQVGEQIQLSVLTTPVIDFQGLFRFQVSVWVLTTAEKNPKMSLVSDTLGALKNFFCPQFTNFRNKPEHSSPTSFSSLF